MKDLGADLSDLKSLFQREMEYVFDGGNFPFLHI